MPLENKIKIQVNDSVYLKDPETTNLGRKIIEGSIHLIDELGFEDFTFKKLANYIESTEASVYRYFESKHHVLTYLCSYYWRWQEYRLLLRLTNIEDPRVRLRRAILALTERIEEDTSFSQIDEVKLHRIVISDSSKIYLNKKVDDENALGFFLAYKEIVQKVSDIVLEINPSFKYPNMLISTVIEGSHHQRFFAEHLPRLTNRIEGEDAITNFYQELVIKEVSHH